MVTVDDRGPELLYDPDPGLWLVGPNEARPADVWIKGAIEALVGDFEVKDKESRLYVSRVLERFAIDESSPLTERLLRWRNLLDDPFPVFLGMIEREHWHADQLEGYLRADDESLVEPAMIDSIDSPKGVTIRRSIAYSTYPDGVIAGVRYVIDTGARTVLAVMNTATAVPGQLIEALDDLDDLARTVFVRDAPA